MKGFLVIKFKISPTFARIDYDYTGVWFELARNEKQTSSFIRFDRFCESIHVYVLDESVYSIPYE